MTAFFRTCWRMALALALALNPLAGMAAPVSVEAPPPCARMAEMAELAEMAGSANAGISDSGAHPTCACCAEQDSCPESSCASMACAAHFVAMLGVRAPCPLLTGAPSVGAGRGANPVAAPAPGRLLRPPID